MLRQTAGEHVDAATITAKVKAAILEEPSLMPSQARVETMQDVVPLSGFVHTLRTPSPEVWDLAREVRGVRRIENDLIVG